ncbi:MAG: hypothetical protein JSW28_08205 [Thermoplasmata archaeon]|nr:MAG: hypothetical protein JSW28_08205 [Thermoplasmata archaeon]
MSNGESEEVPQKRRKPVGSVVVLIFALLIMLFLFQLVTNADFYEEYGRDISKDNWIFIISTLMIIFIIILLISSFPAKAAQPQTFTSQGPTQMVPMPAETPEPAPAEAAPASMDVVEAEPLVVEAEIVEAEPMEEEEAPAAAKSLRMKKPRIIEYPKKVPGGVYGDTIIRVDPRSKLNLRTLLVRSCMICDRQGKCWEEIMDSIPRDQFLENIDCKRGLRTLKSEGGAHAAKKKVKRMKMKVKVDTE